MQEYWVNIFPDNQASFSASHDTAEFVSDWANNNYNLKTLYRIHVKLKKPTHKFERPIFSENSNWMG